MMPVHTSDKIRNWMRPTRTNSSVSTVRRRALSSLLSCTSWWMRGVNTDDTAVENEMKYVCSCWPTA